MGAREEVWHSKLASTLLEQRVWGDIAALLLQQLASAAVSDGALWVGRSNGKSGRGLGPWPQTLAALALVQACRTTIWSALSQKQSFQCSLETALALQSQKALQNKRCLFELAAKITI